MLPQCLFPRSEDAPRYETLNSIPQLKIRLVIFGFEIYAK